MTIRGDETKNDHGKPMWDPLPFGPVGEIVKVLTFGAEKYGPGNWKKTPDARERYFAAMMRHITAWWGGERNDPESGLHHLAHAGCCLLFLMWFDNTCSLLLAVIYVIIKLIEYYFPINISTQVEDGAIVISIFLVLIIIVTAFNL